MESSPASKQNQLRTLRQTIATQPSKRPRTRRFAIHALPLPSRSTNFRRHLRPRQTLMGARTKCSTREGRWDRIDRIPTTATEVVEQYVLAHPSKSAG